MKWFSIAELTKSVTATRYGIDNTPDEQSRRNLETLVEKVLDPLREAFGRPIIVNSGYRCDALNKKVGGAKTSQHTKGCAVDIQSVGDKYNKELFELALEMDWDQIIWEFGTDKCPDWIHISYVEGGNRHKALISKKRNGKTYYYEVKK